jgi:hypothetical protein
MSSLVKGDNKRGEDDMHMENIGHYNERNDSDEVYNYGRNNYDDNNYNHHDDLDSDHYSSNRNTGMYIHICICVCINV